MDAAVVDLALNFADRMEQIFLCRVPSRSAATQQQFSILQTVRWWIILMHINTVCRLATNIYVHISSTALLVPIDIDKEFK